MIPVDWGQEADLRTALARFSCPERHLSDVRRITLADDAAVNRSLEPERFLPMRLSVLGNRLTRAVVRVYADRFRLSAPEWRTMMVLGRYGASRPQDVSRHTAIDKVRVSRAVARLRAAGRITSRTDDEDRRRVILDLTPAGRVIYDQVVPLVLAVEAQLVAELTTEERATLQTLLRKLEARIGSKGDTEVETGLL